MIRRHTARAHAEGGEGLNLQSAAFTTYMVVETSCRQVFSFLVPLADEPSNGTGHSYLSGAVFHEWAERRPSRGIGPPVAMRRPSCRSPHSHRRRSRHPRTDEKGGNPFADSDWEWGVAALAEEEAFDTGFASLALIGPPRWLTTFLRQRQAPGNAQLGHVVPPVRAPGPPSTLRTAPIRQDSPAATLCLVGSNHAAESTHPSVPLLSSSDNADAKVESLRHPESMASPIAHAALPCWQTCGPRGQDSSWKKLRMERDDATKAVVMIR